MNCPECGTEATSGKLEHNNLQLRMKCDFCGTEFTEFTTENKWRGKSDKYLYEMRVAGVPENIVEAFYECKDLTLRKNFLKSISNKLKDS